MKFPRVRTRLRLRGKIPAFRWSLDVLQQHEASVDLSGWALQFDGGGGHEFELTVNGYPVENVVRCHRPDLSAAFPGVLSAAQGGFTAGLRVNPSELLKQDSILRFSARAVRDGRAIGEPQVIRQIWPLHERWPWPDEVRMTRVHGAPAPEAFARMGFSTFMQLRDVFARITGYDMASAGRILDWGCGCGRLLRYLDYLHGPSIVGADIDADNVEWCREYLPFAGYEVLPLNPPSRLRSGDFDLVIGISVLTHLTENSQHRWLSELRRIAAPRAMVLMTVHGPAAALLSRGADFLDAVLFQGFYDNVSFDFDGVLEDPGYYRTTYHSHEYIRKVWRKWFDVIEIVPALVGGMQDLVVLRAH